MLNFFYQMCMKQNWCFRESCQSDAQVPMDPEKHLTLLLQRAWKSLTATWLTTRAMQVADSTSYPNHISSSSAALLVLHCNISLDLSPNPHVGFNSLFWPAGKQVILAIHCKWVKHTQILELLMCIAFKTVLKIWSLYPSPTSTGKSSWRRQPVHESWYFSHINNLVLSSCCSVL